MSEQLSLDGLLGGGTPETKPKKSATKTTTRKNGISERIDALLEKEKARKNSGPSGVVVPTEAASSGTVTATSKVAAAPSAIAASPNAVSESPDDAAFEELLEEPQAPSKVAEPEVLTISALNRSIKNLLEKNFPFLWVKGEISNLKVPGSGHMYFTLKDSQSQIRAIMFRGFAQALKFKPEDGMEVLVRCKVTAYEPRGDYQLFCEVMEPVGFGALQVAFEKLKEKLQGEGLFDAARKRPIPLFPSRIGIVTSPTGAAIRDMINVLSRRAGGSLDVTILPTSVQGDKAPGEIVKAIDLANRLGTERFDVLIVGRGGGSLEDLWAFNMEEVVRAVARSKIPVISAVGHEVDFTICDFVADLRAPTPSAAAELVVKNKNDLIERVELITRQLIQQMNKKIQIGKTHVFGVSKRLIDPKRRLQDLMLRCDEWTDRLIQSMQRFLQDGHGSVKFLREKLGSPERRLQLWSQRLSHADQRSKTAMNRVLEVKKTRLTQMMGLLNGLSPLAILDRGYAVVKKGTIIVKEAALLKKGDVVDIKLHQGDVQAEIK